MATVRRKYNLGSSETREKRGTSPGGKPYVARRFYQNGVHTGSSTSVGKSKKDVNVTKLVEGGRHVTKKLSKEAAKEKKEHPWATKAEAARIAADHSKKRKRK